MSPVPLPHAGQCDRSGTKAGNGLWVYVTGALQGSPRRHCVSVMPQEIVRLVQRY